MSEQTLLTVGAIMIGIVTAIVWYANKTNARLESSVPLQVALDLARYLAASTPTMLDDEIVETVQNLIKPVFTPIDPNAPVSDTFVEAKG